MWNVTIDDVESISIGAGILGTGGGGNPYLGKIRMQELLKQGYSVNVMDIDDLPDDALVAAIGWMGAPTVGIEKLANGEESRLALEALESYVGRKVDVVICAEVGGANSIEPLITGALTGKPVVDADSMGRAFPQTQMSTHFIYGLDAVPAAIVDEKGNKIIFSGVTDSFQFEKFARDLTVLMGCRSTLAMPAMRGDDVRRTAVKRTLSLAKRVGDAVRQARATKASQVDAILGVTGGSQLFNGKLIDVLRRTTGGFARGDVVIEGLGDYRGEWLHIAFQNENLVAWRGTRSSRDAVVACVPDLICMIESETGEPITTEQLRYGLRVTILGVPCTDMYRTPEALKVVGPAAFGYTGVTYHPIPKTPGQGIE